jgi:hypothetical protein
LVTAYVISAFLKEKVVKRIKVRGRRGRRRKQLLDVHKEKRGYWKMKEDALEFKVCGSVHH